MGMSEAEFRAGVIQLLKGWGIEAESVPTQEGVRTPDLRGKADGEVYAVELKQKDSDRTVEGVFESLAAGGSTTLVPLGMSRDSATQSTTREAAHQLRGEDSETFRLVWIHCEGYDADSDEMRARASLLGSETFFCRRPGGKAVECHFFSESDFWRYRKELDGGVVSRQITYDRINFLVIPNPYSNKLEAFRNSRLMKAVRDHAILDIAKEESEGKCLWADCALDRRQEAAVIAYLNKKYNRDLVKAPLKRYSVIVRE